MAETTQPPPPRRARAVADPQLPQADQVRATLAQVESCRRAESEVSAVPRRIRQDDAELPS